METRGGRGSRRRPGRARRLVAAQVLAVDDAAAAPHLGLDQLGGAAGVEAVAPLARDPAQRLGEVALHERSPTRGHRPFGRNTGRWRELAQPRLVALQRLREPLVHDDPLGQVDRRLDQVGPGQGAEALVRLPHPRDRARHARGQVPDQRAVGQVPLRVQEHVARGARSGAARGSRARRWCRPPCARPGSRRRRCSRLRVHHREREVGRDRRVHRVAAPPQDLGADLARDPVGGGHHAPAGVGRHHRAGGDPPLGGEARRHALRGVRRAGDDGALLRGAAAAEQQQQERRGERAPRADRALGNRA
jgi:hypothetical protein